MQASDYRTLKDRLFTYYTVELDLHNNEYLQGQLQLVSAGLTNYLPSIPFERHAAIYRQILLHKKLSRAEQAAPVVLDYIQTAGCSAEAFRLLRRGAAIICSFHTGSYRVLNLLLYAQQVPFTLVMGAHAIEKEGHELRALFAELPFNNGVDGLQIIDAEAANAGLQMLRALKNGRTLVMYIDGNTGAGTATKHNDNNCTVDFLEQQLYARKGIAYLAHVAKVPLLPVACYRKTIADIQLHFHAPILPDKSEDREFFSTKTTQALYDFIAPFIVQYPEQWEGWLYLHKTARIVKAPVFKPQATSKKSASQKLCFDSKRFGIFKLAGKPFLLEKHTYLFYELSTELYILLNKCTVSAISSSRLPNDVLFELERKGVLTYK